MSEILDGFGSSLPKAGVEPHVSDYDTEVVQPQHVDQFASFIQQHYEGDMPEILVGIHGETNRIAAEVASQLGNIAVCRTVDQDGDSVLEEDMETLLDLWEPTPGLILVLTKEIKDKRELKLIRQIQDIRYNEVWPKDVPQIEVIALQGAEKDEYDDSRDELESSGIHWFTVFN
jgi:hypothetical protein